MRVLILWWRRGERREGGGSERQSGMDGKSRDLLAGIKRVFETRAECSHTRWRYLCFDEKVVAFVQPEITLSFSLSLSLSICLPFYITIWIFPLQFYKLFREILGSMDRNFYNNIEKFQSSKFGANTDCLRLSRDVYLSTPEKDSSRRANTRHLAEISWNLFLVGGSTRNSVAATFKTCTFPDKFHL